MKILRGLMPKQTWFQNRLIFCIQTALNNCLTFDTWRFSLCRCPKERIKEVFKKPLTSNRAKSKMIIFAVITSVQNITKAYRSQIWSIGFLLHCQEMLSTIITSNSPKAKHNLFALITKSLDPEFHSSQIFPLGSYLALNCTKQLLRKSRGLRPT